MKTTCRSLSILAAYVLLTSCGPAPSAADGGDDTQPGVTSEERTMILAPTEDVFVSNVGPTTVYDWNYTLLSWSSSGIEDWILLKYWAHRLDDVPQEDIVSVKLVLKDYNGSQANDENTLYFDVYQCTSPWFEDQTYWDHRPTLGSSRIAFGHISGSTFGTEISLPNGLVHSGDLAAFGIAIVPSTAYDPDVQSGETTISTKAMPSKELDSNGTYLKVVYIHRF